MAFSKAKRGVRVPWIGCELWTEQDFVKASIQEARARIGASGSKAQIKHLISLKDLRSCTGKCDNFASLLYTWRTFLKELWAARH